MREEYLVFHRWDYGICWNAVYADSYEDAADRFENVICVLSEIDWRTLYKYPYYAVMYVGRIYDTNAYSKVRTIITRSSEWIQSHWLDVRLKWEEDNEI